MRRAEEPNPALKRARRTPRCFEPPFPQDRLKAGSGSVAGVHALPIRTYFAGTAEVRLIIMTMHDQE